MVLAADLVARVTADTAGASRGILSFSQNLIGMAGSAGMAVFGIGQLVEGIGSAVTGFLGGAAEMERYQTQLTTLMGSSDMAKDRLQALAVFGASTPFELPELVRAEKVLQGFGLTGQKALDMTGLAYDDFFTRVGDIAAGVGRPFEEIALTFGKFSSGATGEAISRLQELGVATREQMAELGVEFSKSGELVSPLPVAMQAVMTLTGQKFKGGMDALSNTFEGRLSTLQDAWGGLMRTLGTPVLAVAGPAVKAFSDFIGGPLTANAEKLGPLFEQSIGKIGTEFERLQPLIQIGSDAVTTFQQAMAGEWSTGEGINPLVNSIGIFATSLRNDVLPAAEQLGTWFQSVAGPMIQPFMDSLRAGGEDALPKLGAGIRQVIEQAGPFATMLITGIRPALEGISGFLTGTVVPALTTLWDIIGPKITPAVQHMGEAFASVGSEFAALGPTFAELGASLAPALPILGGIAAIVGGVMLAGMISSWEMLSGLLMGVPVMIKGVIQGITDVFTGIAEVATNLLALIQALIHGDWAGAWAAAAGIVEGFGTIIGGILTGLIGIVGGIFTGIVSAAINVLSQLQPGAAEQLQAMKATIISVVNSIDLRQMAWTMINGFIDGIAAKMPAVAAILGQLRGLFPSSPAKWGPWSTLPEWSSAFDSMSPALADAVNSSEGGLSALRDQFSATVGEMQRSSLGEQIEYSLDEARRILAGFSSSNPAVNEAFGAMAAPTTNNAGSPAGATGGEGKKGEGSQVKTLTLSVPIQFNNSRFGLGPDDNLTPRDFERLVDLLVPPVAIEVARLIDEEGAV